MSITHQIAGEHFLREAAIAGDETAADIVRALTAATSAGLNTYLTHDQQKKLAEEQARTSAALAIARGQAPVPAGTVPAAITQQPQPIEGNVFTKRLGGVPVWGWGLITIGTITFGALLLQSLRRK